MSSLNQILLAERQRHSDVVRYHRTSSKETKLKTALIGAAAVAAAAFATPALAQQVIEDPGYCAQFYPNANCENLGAGNPYTDGGYWRNGNAGMPNHATRSARRGGYAEPDRYHGGPKEDD